MQTVTNLMGDFTKSLISADRIGLDAIGQEYDNVISRTFHSEPGLGYNGPSTPGLGA